jgi:hypothetical protein
MRCLDVRAEARDPLLPGNRVGQNTIKLNQGCPGQVALAIPSFHDAVMRP